MTKPFLISKEVYDLVFAAHALVFLLKHFDNSDGKYYKAIKEHIAELEKCLENTVATC